MNLSSHCAALLLVLCIELPAHVIYKIVLNESKRVSSSLCRSFFKILIFFSVIEKPRKIEISKNGLNNNGFEQNDLPKIDIITKC